MGGQRSGVAFQSRGIGFIALQPIDLSPIHSAMLRMLRASGNSRRVGYPKGEPLITVYRYRGEWCFAPNPAKGLGMNGNSGTEHDPKANAA